jgi:G3E family GTPase
MRLRTDARTPVTVLTGYLGSGKTTLLNAMLRDEAFADTAVVINEFGEIAIDHLLVESSIENALVLQSGCICCVIRGDLVDTLQDLHRRGRDGSLPPFRRVVVETTGLADPAPIMNSILRDPGLAPSYRLGGVITVVDTLYGASHLAREPEAVKQVALADRIVLTKIDLGGADRAEALGDMIARINPDARIERSAPGAIPQALLAEDETLAPAGRAARLDSAALAGTPHAGDVLSCCILREDSIPEAALIEWLDAITSLRGADLLRLKGLVNVEGVSAPVVVHAVHHYVHEPMLLPQWPDDDARSRIVVIGRNLSEAGLTASLDAAVRAATAPQP